MLLGVIMTIFLMLLAKPGCLPFPDNCFDIVCAFTAFHWFNNERSVKEIERVIKPEGCFVSVLKTNQQNQESKDFREGYMNILSKFAGPDFDTTNKQFDEESYLYKVFQDIHEKEFLVDEKYDMKHALYFSYNLLVYGIS